MNNTPTPRRPPTTHPPRRRLPRTSNDFANDTRLVDVPEELAQNSCQDDGNESLDQEAQKRLQGKDGHACGIGLKLPGGRAQATSSRQFKDIQRTTRQKAMPNAVGWVFEDEHHCRGSVGSARALGEWTSKRTVTGKANDEETGSFETRAERKRGGLCRRGVEVENGVHGDLRLNEQPKSS